MTEKPIEDMRRTAQAHQPIRSVHEGQLSAPTNQKRPRRTAKRMKQSEASAKDRLNEATNQVAFTKKPRRASQPIRFIGRTFFGESTRSDVQNRIGQSDHLDSYLTVVSRSHSSDNLQDWMVRIVSANHITWTVISAL